jgi:N-acetylglucosamine kinase-like BadF-type ATPase
MSEFYLGVDGGQSTTKALIADASGRIIGHGVGGPCNHVSGSAAREKFRAAVGGCVEEACREAGIDYSSVVFAAACLGFSGGPEDKEAYTLELIRARRYSICHDAEIALTGAAAGQAGIIVIAGTGSIGFGRNLSRQTARAGGWGYIFGDEGSAFDLVKQALRAALRMEEGWGHETALRTKLLAATGAPDAKELMHYFYTPEFPRSRVATFAHLVDEAAREGDKMAQTILSTAARDLMRLARGVHKRLFPKHQVVPVCYIGGVFRSELIRDNFAREVKRAIGCDVQPPRFSPAAGAILEALHLDNNESALTNVAESEQ